MTAVAPTPAVKHTLVEPGGIEAIPIDRRHGSPWSQFTVWTAPNLEFATVFVGVIAVAFFGLGFGQAMAALILGNALGCLTQGILASWGPRDGVAQMVIGRSAFGTRGNILPAALNALVAGLGWFAVNSVSGAFALAALTGMPAWLALLIIVVIEVAVAFIGHDLVQQFERYASIVLGIIFLVATVFVLASGALTKGSAGAPAGASFGGVTLTVAAAFGYAAGWNPYASDYSRYLGAGVSRAKTGLAAGLGNFISCTVLMAAGAAAATALDFGKGNPTSLFTSTHLMPSVVSSFTLFAIAVGAIAANALNLYSSSMSFLTIGIRLPFKLRRAIVAVVCGVLGFFIALAALPNAGESYENFLLVIAYWIAPWLGVVLVDRYLRRGTQIAPFLADDARYSNIAGPVSMVLGIVVSIALFSNQTEFVGLIAKATASKTSSGIGDLTPLVGFIVAAVAYYGLFRYTKPGVGAAIPKDAFEVPPTHVDPASAA